MDGATELSRKEGKEEQRSRRRGNEERAEELSRMEGEDEQLDLYGSEGRAVHDSETC